MYYFLTAIIPHRPINQKNYSMGGQIDLYIGCAAAIGITWQTG